MNNADLQALKDKREANIQKLDNYLKAGKTAEEKIVSKLIAQIRNAEETLIAEGIELSDRINNDGTFTTVLKRNDSAPSNEATEIVMDNENNKENLSENTEPNENSNKDNTNNDKDNANKNKSTKKTAPTKKLRDENTPSKPEITKIGVTVKETVKSKIDALADDNNMKPNEVVNDLLERVFDGKNFSVQIEKKEKTKVTSFNIPKQMDKAMTRISKATDVPKSEIFNKLLEEALKEFFK